MEQAGVLFNIKSVIALEEIQNENHFLIVNNQLYSRQSL